MLLSIARPVENSVRNPQLESPEAPTRNREVEPQAAMSDRNLVKLGHIPMCAHRKAEFL